MHGEKEKGERSALLVSLPPSFATHPHGASPVLDSSYALSSPSLRPSSRSLTALRFTFFRYCVAASTWPIFAAFSLFPPPHIALLLPYRFTMKRHKSGGKKGEGGGFFV